MVELEQHREDWLQLATQRVMSPFLEALARSNGWRKLGIVSPWISEFGHESGVISFTQLLKRLKDDNATAYVVTRPPESQWHQDAVDKIDATGHANIVFVRSLHTKLYCANTLQSSFALIGSANMTRQSFFNRELGLLVKSTGKGIELFRKLAQEAADIYHHPDRSIYKLRKF